MGNIDVDFPGKSMLLRAFSWPGTRADIGDHSMVRNS